MSQTLPYTTEFRLQRVIHRDDTFVIRGKILCPSLGWQYTIERVNEGVWDDPEGAAFELSANGPAAGGDQVEELLVEYSFKDNTQLRKVAIRLQGSLKTADGAETEFLQL